MVDKDLQELIFKYLVDLRDGGSMNMLGAGENIARVFKCTREEGNTWLRLWIDSVEKEPKTYVSLGDILDKMEGLHHG